MSTSIVIVDDHILIAKALKSIISNFRGFEVLYECENGKELQTKFENSLKIPDIILLDISMPVMDGFETAKWIKQHYPKILILTLSMQDDEQSLIRMVKNGAKGYLLKNASPTELEKALNAMVKFGCYYPEWAANRIYNMFGEEEDKKEIPVEISEREKEFLKYVSTEMNYKEIGEIMCCSSRTIESYRDNLCEKLHLKTRVGLAVYAIKNGYVQ